MEIEFGTALSSFVSLTVGTLLGAEITRLFYRPKVIVKYKNIDPLEDKTGIYWSIQVENYGRTVAKECSAVISLYNINIDDMVAAEDIDSNEELPEYRNENIDIETPRKQIVNKDHFRPLNRVSVCWAKLGNPDVIDINPGISQSVDLCKFHSHGLYNYFVFPSEDGWRRVRVRIKARNLKGHILICPANEFPTRVDFMISIMEDGKSEFKAIKPNFLYKFKRNKFE